MEKLINECEKKEKIKEIEHFCDFKVFKLDRSSINNEEIVYINDELCNDNQNEGRN